MKIEFERMKWLIKRESYDSLFLYLNINKCKLSGILSDKNTIYSMCFYYYYLYIIIAVNNKAYEWKI
jgi:hypothetical protein